MKTEIFKNRRWVAARRRAGQWPVAALVVASLLAATRLTAMPEVETLTGGPSHFYPQAAYGYLNGFTDTEAKFRTPFGIALDGAGNYLFVADRDNDAVRQLDLANNQTYTFVPNAFVPASLVSKPVGVGVDVAGNVYVLNRGNGNNGSVLQFDSYGELVMTSATGLTNATALALDGAANIYVVVNGTNVIRIDAGTTNRTLIPAAFPAGTALQGIVVKRNGLLAACDSARHGIYLINPNSGVVTTNAGFHGAGDFTTANNVASSTTAMFNQPYGVAEAGDGTLLVADYGNHRVKVVLTSGVVTNLYGCKSNLWYGPANPSQGIYPGWWDGTVSVPDLLGGVEARSPVGVAFASDGTVYTSEIYYHLLRKITNTELPPPPPPPPTAPTILTVTTNYGQIALTWSEVIGATNYFVKRAPSSGGPYTILASTTTTSYTDNTVVNGTTYYYVVSASNGGGEGPNSLEVSAAAPVPPVPDPQIGYVEFPPPGFHSVFHPVSSVVFNNDKPIVIIGTAGSQTFYEYANTLIAANVPNPTSSSASAPVGYVDGLFEGQVTGLTVASISPNLTIKAVGQQPGRPNSAIVTAQFQFIVGNPLVIGDNAAQFSVSDITKGAELWYTTDGSDPTNAAPSQLAGTIPGGTETNVINLSLAFPPGGTNLTFKIRGFKANYHPSGVVTTTFSSTNFNANKISFGFAAGEASSDFVASPGQLFYAPVTLSILPGTKMYSLQFNVTVTNAGPNPGAPVVAGAYSFASMLRKPDLGSPGYFNGIPTAMALDIASTNPAPGVPDSAFAYNNQWFQSLHFVNTNINLVGVGWLERYGETNLYDTKAQDLIKYSSAHDTLFDENFGKVILGGYMFSVPFAPGFTTPGQTYQIQLGRPTATSDGIGAPGSDVYIATPTNGSLTAGAINAIKIVTTGQRKYIAGDVYPFRWFNAGDFGKGHLANTDVMQVFQSAIYGLNYPPFGSDFFDGMDSCGATFIDNGNGYLEVNTPLVLPSELNPLFDGNDTTINQIAFGDGFLDVCDVYVTFRRSLDPSLTWFRRFWTNDGVTAFRAAEVVGNAPVPGLLSKVATTNPPFAKFASADFVAAAGQTLQVPITAQISGTYPLRTLLLNLTVSALDGSPTLTTPVQFAPNPALGAPTITDSKGNGNYAATWLNSSGPGLTGNATLGYLTVQIPAGASSSAAYAIRFEHASASPNGLAAIPNKTQTGLITLSDRSASSWNDGIPDSWRLRYFGSIKNVLSAATADADGDGANNRHESKAGTDPNDAASVLRLRANRESGQGFVIRWPSAANKQYVVERSASLDAPTWTCISTNAGTGADIEFHDNSGGPVLRFYRVRPLD